MPTKEQYAKNKDLFKERAKQWRALNKDKHRAYSKLYRETHLDQYNAYFREYFKKNPEDRRFFASKRRARVKSATPIWLSSEQIIEIKTFYKNCPEGHEVDHIIPLNGKNVSGLNVPWNLQYLTVKENRQKSNKVAA